MLTVTGKLKLCLFNAVIAGNVHCNLITSAAYRWLDHAFARCYICRVDLEKRLRCWSVEWLPLTLQEQGMFLKQQLADVFDQLKAKDTQLSAMHQQLQAQHAQQTQRAQHAQQAQQARHGQHPSQDPPQAAAQEASQQSAADDGCSFFPPSHQSPSGITSPAIIPVASLLQSHLTPALLPSSGDSSSRHPQLQTMTTVYTDSTEAAESQMPRHRFVKQRVQELQSRESSPEKSLSSVSSRLNSPRAGLLGSTSTFRARLLEGALDSSNLEAAGSCLARAGQSSSSGKAAADEADIVSVSSTAGKGNNAADFNTSVITARQQQEDSKLHSSLRPSDPSMLRQQARRVTCASDVRDRAAASSAAEEQSRSRSPSPPQDRASSPTALQRISPRYQLSAQISSSSLQLPSDASPAGMEGSDSGPLPWGGGLEVGSPGMELPSDEESDLESAFGDKGTTRERLVAELPEDTMHMGAAMEREDSAQFGPEASAMSLPGLHHMPLLHFHSKHLGVISNSHEQLMPTLSLGYSAAAAAHAAHLVGYTQLGSIPSI